MGKYDMEIVKFKLADLVSPEFNPRRISDDEFERLKNSIRSYGYSDPIIVNKRNNHIVAGNQRFRALKELNRENHGKYTMIDVVLVDLDLSDEKAFNIGHNKIGGEFDEIKLESLLDELEEMDYDMDLTGFVDEFEDIDTVDIDEFGVRPSQFDSKEEFIVSVKCDSASQMDSLHDTLRKQGYNVKSTRYQKLYNGLYRNGLWLRGELFWRVVRTYLLLQRTINIFPCKGVIFLLFFKDTGEYLFILHTPSGILVFSPLYLMCYFLVLPYFTEHLLGKDTPAVDYMLIRVNFNESPIVL